MFTDRPGLRLLIPSVASNCLGLEGDLGIAPGTLITEDGVEIDEQLAGDRGERKLGAATRAAISSTVRTVGRPPQQLRRPRCWPLSRASGARPTARRSAADPADPGRGRCPARSGRAWGRRRARSAATDPAPARGGYEARGIRRNLLGEASGLAGELDGGLGDIETEIHAGETRGISSLHEDLAAYPCDL
jgi:hypothetical protein